MYIVNNNNNNNIVFFLFLNFRRNFIFNLVSTAYVVRNANIFNVTLN